MASTSANATQPPPLEAPNVISLVAGQDSKIVNVSLYTGRAEVSRLFKLETLIGHNNVVITGLPTFLDPSSLGVEGRGAGTINDVTVSTVPPPTPPTTSPALVASQWQRETLVKELERYRKSILAVDRYMNALNPTNVNVAQVTAATEMYLTSAEKIENKVLELERELRALDKEMALERTRLQGPTLDPKLRTEVKIGVFAEHTAQIQLLVKYAVHAASWTPVYDLRVNMETKDTPVTLVYKAAITQSSGESWDDVPLTIETASPTYSLEIPKLRPWNVSVYKPSVMRRDSSILGSRFASKKRETAAATVDEEEESDQDMGFGLFDDGPPAPPMAPPVAAVTSKGNVTATFQVPGRISVPPDNVAHKVTITELHLNAIMKWIVVPKENTRVHLTAKIKNASDYTLLPGEASVYVNGSFISKSNIPAVNPQESFVGPLGLDPSVRITYHPRGKRVSQSGFYTKTSDHTFTQRITIANTKSNAVDQLVILDQIPVSQDSQITIKLISPALTMPSNMSSINIKPDAKQLPAPVKVMQGVTAQWDAGDAATPDIDALGKDGMVKWVCAVPAQETINLTLQWEVSAPAKPEVVVVGLD